MLENTGEVVHFTVKSQAVSLELNQKWTFTDENSRTSPIDLCSEILHRPAF